MCTYVCMCMCVCVCVRVCQNSKAQSTGIIITRLGRWIVHDTSWSTVLFDVKQLNDKVTCRGVARNLLRGGGVWDTEIPQRSPGAKPQWGLEVKPPEAGDIFDYSTEQNT